MNTENVISWVDIPVIDAIDYFSNLISTFINLGVRYAQFIGLIGLCWSAFKLINSRFSIKDFWWDTFYRWIVFILLLNLYVPVTIGIGVVANKIGINAGNGKQAIISSLKNMKTNIEKDLAKEKEWEDSLEVELRTNFDNLELPSLSADESYSSYLDNVYDAVNASKFSSRAQKKKAKELVNSYKEKKADQSIFGARTLKTLNSILIEKEMDGSDGDNLTDSYLDLNIFLHDSKGNESYVLSPASVLRVAALCCQVLWEQNQLVLTSDLDDINENDINFMKKGFSKLSSTFHHIPSMIMTMLCCIGIIFCVIFSNIQYLMSIIEYAIISGIGAMFIPFILFDGTKELPKKLVPVFMAFFVKMIVMNVILFFIFNELLINTVQILTSDCNMNWVDFAGQMFFCFIALILSANGPKIASTIMTGQPQLSMGEAVQMAGAVAGAAMTTSKMAKAAGKTVKEGTRKTAQGTMDFAGTTAKYVSAGKSAYNTVQSSGGGTKLSRKAAAAGVFSAATTDLKDKILNTSNNFLHGSQTSSTHGGGGSGSQAHQRSGQITKYDIPDEDSRTINSTSNPHFANATRYDKNTMSNVNMTTAEFINEKIQQGDDIGRTAAEKALSSAENKPSKNQTDNGQNELPDNLTGNERET